MKRKTLTPERVLSVISAIYLIAGAIKMLLSIVGLFMKESLQQIIQIFMGGLGFLTIGLILIFIVEFSHKLSRIENKLDFSINNK